MGEKIVFNKLGPETFDAGSSPISGGVSAEDRFIVDVAQTLPDESAEVATDKLAVPDDFVAQDRLQKVSDLMNQYSEYFSPVPVFSVSDLSSVPASSEVRMKINNFLAALRQSPEDETRLMDLAKGVAQALERETHSTVAEDAEDEE